MINNLYYISVLINKGDNKLEKLLLVEDRLTGEPMLTSIENISKNPMSFKPMAFGEEEADRAARLVENELNELGHENFVVMEEEVEE